jgi:hypothetical protein
MSTERLGQTHHWSIRPVCGRSRGRLLRKSLPEGKPSLQRQPNLPDPSDRSRRRQSGSIRRPPLLHRQRTPSHQRSACRLACEIENEFLCRSFLYKGSPQGSQYNCQLFHLDHKTLPDGPSTYLNAERPLIDNGERIGSYFENLCESKSSNI